MRILGVAMKTGTLSIGEWTSRIFYLEHQFPINSRFYLYKLPNHYSNESKSGLEYLFITPTAHRSWELSSHRINSSSSIPAKTLSPIYSENINKLLIAMYNDEPTNDNVDNVRGHTKGVVVADEQSGFWLVHSVPKFPPAIGEKFDFPHTGTMYGQSFLCISFDADQLENVGKQLQFNEPRFYSSHVPDHLKR
jgi:deoxyribonuclease-2